MDTAAAQQTTERRCGQALAERGDNAASDENMLGDVFLRITMCSSNHGISLYHPCMTPACSPDASAPDMAYLNNTNSRLVKKHAQGHNHVKRLIRQLLQVLVETH